MLSVIKWAVVLTAINSASGSYANATEKLGLCSYSASCSAGNNAGVCVSISAGCCAGGTDTAGLCPGSSDIRCCTQPTCSTPSGTGSCMSTSTCSGVGGKAVSGYCAGPSDIQCCIKPVCGYEATCSSGGYSGACVSVSSGCCSSGTTTSGLCPGSSDIKCCTKERCATPSGTGTCMQTSLCSSQGGHSVGGYCLGPSDLQCCVSGPAPTPTTSELGVDVSTTITDSAASCLASSGVSYVIPRGYMSIGEVDTRVCPSLIAAANSGIKTRDTYLFPCPTCSKSARTQIDELIAHLRSNCNSQWSGRVWLDIEGSQYWTGNTGVNQAWYRELVDACNGSGIRCGVYSSASQWSAIFGTLSFVYGNNLPLWYAHYDSNPSFSDFSSFAGWSSPHAKQFQGDVTLCSMGVDKNYSPAF